MVLLLMTSAPSPPASAFSHVVEDMTRYDTIEATATALLANLRYKY